MKSAFGCTGREKNSAGAAADWVLPAGLLTNGQKLKI